MTSIMSRDTSHLVIMHPESHLPRLTSARKRKRSREWTEVEAVTLAEVRQALQEDHQLR